MVILKSNNSVSSIFLERHVEYDFYYEILLNNTMIGISAISKKSNNMMYIYIKPEYRGNNYGKEAFNLLINEFRKLNINVISLEIEKNNTQMLRILEHEKYKIIRSSFDFNFYEMNI